MKLRPVREDIKMSQEFLTVVTRKGQITIPAEVRRAMGINRGDRIAIIVENDRQVCLTRSESAVMRTAGLLKSEMPAVSAEELQNGRRTSDR